MDVGIFTDSGAACPGLIEASDAGDGAAAGFSHSGAACPGLIEALPVYRRRSTVHRIPGQPAPASLKPARLPIDDERLRLAFRGSLPRPH